jgi:15-cis-phytoene desaturase
MGKNDVIIIGTGLAGLSCGYYLSKKGKKVLLVEKMPMVGGRTASWIENGMDVESGLHRMLGFYEALPELMKECDIDIEKAVLWEDEIEIVLPNDISGSFGMSFFKPVKTVVGALSNNDFISPVEKAQLVKFFIGGFKDLKDQQKTLDAITLYDYAIKKGVPERVIFRVLTPLTEGLFFLPPEKYSTYNFFALFAPYLPKLHKTRAGAFSAGMTESLTGPMAKKIMDLGSEVITDTSVKEIIMEGKTIKGIITGNETYYADSVVIATGLKEAEALLKNSAIKDYNPFEKLTTMPSVTLQMLLSEPALERDRVTFSPGTVLSSYSEQSRTTFRNTKGRLSIILAQAEKYVHAKPETMLQDIVNDAEKLKLNLRKETILDYKVVRWPHEFYSYAPGNAEHVPNFETPFQGLYLAGDYTNQKYLQTMEGAVVSGKIVAEKIT